MLRAHKQAWTWQDQWFGLMMADIREIEKETQELLKNKMQNELASGIIDDEQSSETNLEQKHDVDFNLIDKDTTEKMNELTLEIPQKRKTIRKSSKNDPANNHRESKLICLETEGGSYGPGTIHEQLFILQIK